MPESVRINFVTGATRRYVADVEALAGIPARLEAAVAGQRADWYRFNGGVEGAWPPARVLGHMIAYTRQTRENLHRMSWMTDPVLNVMDDGAEAERNSWEAREPERLLEWFSEAVAETVELLKELPDSSWGRPGQSPSFGRRSIRQSVRAAARHLDEHVAQLEALARG